MSSVVLAVVGMNTGTGRGTGTKMGTGHGALYIIMGDGTYTGIGMGKIGGGFQVDETLGGVSSSADRGSVCVCLCQGCGLQKTPFVLCMGRHEVILFTMTGGLSSCNNSAADTFNVSCTESVADFCLAWLMLSVVWEASLVTGVDGLCLISVPDLTVVCLFVGCTPSTWNPKMDLNFVAHEYRQKLRSVLSDMTMWYCALATTEHMLHEVTEESELVLVVVVVVFVEFSVVDVPLATDFLGLWSNFKQFNEQ